jgi:membrane protein
MDNDEGEDQETSSPLPSSRLDYWELRWNRFEGAVHEYFGRGPMRRAMRAILLSLYNHHGLELASAMAFDLFLAVIPLLALAGWAMSTVLQGDAEMLQYFSALLNLTPSDVQHVVNQHAERFFGGSLAPVALIGALWLGSGAFNTVMSAFQRTLTSRERPWWTRRAIALFCVLILLAALTLGAWIAVAVSAGRHVLWRILPSSITFYGAEYIGLVVSALTVALLVAGFFRIGVSRDVPKRRIWPGTLLTLSIGTLTSYAFSVYAQTLARYAFYYGSLAAVAVLLAWLWICSFALLLGAELNAYLEGQQRSGLSSYPASRRRL